MLNLNDYISALCVKYGTYIYNWLYHYFGRNILFIYISSYGGYRVWVMKKKEMLKF